MADKRPDRPAWIRLSGVGVEFAAVVAVFAVLGYWVDRSLSTKPWGILIGAFLGLVGGGYNLIRQSLAAFKDADATDRDPEGTDRDKTP